VVSVSAQGKEADISLDPESKTLKYGPNAEPKPIEIPLLGHGINIAVALGIAWAIDVTESMALGELSRLPVASHRSELTETPHGVAIIDDTYNSNPPGAKRAIESAAALANERGGKLFVVTPGMVELGSLQHRRNRELASQVSELGGELYAVGLTNRRALKEGGGEGTKVFLTRDEAVGAVNQVAGSGDVILYENDLPDHYP